MCVGARALGFPAAVIPFTCLAAAFRHMLSVAYIFFECEGCNFCAVAFVLAMVAAAVAASLSHVHGMHQLHMRARARLHSQDKIERLQCSGKCDLYACK